MGEEKDTTKRDNYQRVLRIDKNVGLERKSESVEGFNQSFFRDNYYNAFLMTKKILMRNESMNNEKGWCTEQKKLYNIITFCGGRGSGKTSVMDSVVKVLQNGADKAYEDFIREYETGRNEGEKESSPKRLLEDYEFVCMDPIDASLLEEQEDILDVVLSKMLERVMEVPFNISRRCQQKRGECYGKEEICRLLEHICRKRWQFQQRKDRRYGTGEASVEMLENLAGSLKIRSDLQDLIDRYLGILCQKGKDSSYLVISIDDLDLHGNAYEMLEQLHRYLMIPRVLIYLSVSEREIRSVCRKRFEKIYESPGELAMSYLEKVLPYSRRIYLPATFSGDFFNVVAGKNEEERSDNVLNLYGYPVKRFLLREIARRTWVFYDGSGLDTHFYEIENLRTLINTYYLLESMKEYDPQKVLKDRVEIFKSYNNMFVRDQEKLRNDVVGRMADEKLDGEEQRRIFRQYYKEDFSSNGEYLLREVVRHMEGEAYDYNYGELLGTLYMLGEKQQEFTPLIQCILALATIELTQNYMYAFFMEDRNSSAKWKGYISGSVIGNWGNQIFPKVKDKGYKSFEIAYMKELKGIFTAADVSGIKCGSEIQEKKKICRQLIEQKGFIETVMLLCAFLTGKAKVTLRISESQNEKQLIQLSVSECTFDILGFVIHSMDCEAFAATVKKIFLEMLDEYIYEGKEEEKNNLEQEFGNLIENNSFMEEYRSWNKQYKGMALPIYSLDIMYNMLKQVKKKMEQEYPQGINKKDFLKVLQTFYRHIGDYLIEEDLFYGERIVTDKEIKEERQYTDFYGGFLENPFVKYFVREKKEEEKTEEEKTLDGKKWTRPGPTIERPLENFPVFFQLMFG